MSQIPPPPPSSVPPPPPAPPPPPPAKKSNKLLIIILVILGVILLMIGGCAVACLYVGKKAKDYSAKYEKHPELAGFSMAVSMHPDLQVVSEDADHGIITVRNKKTGQVVKLNMEQIQTGNFNLALEELVNGKKPEESATVEPTPEPPPAEESAPAEPAYKEPTVSAAKTAAMEGALKKFPKAVPAYPQAKILEASCAQVGGVLNGHYVAITSDSPQQVADYYAEKIRAAGLEVAAQGEDANDYGPTTTVGCYHDTGAITVSAESQQDGKVRISVDFVGTPKS